MVFRETLDEVSSPAHIVDSRAKSLLPDQAKAEKVDERGGPEYTRLEAEIMDTVAARVIVRPAARGRAAGRSCGE